MSIAAKEGIDTMGVFDEGLSMVFSRLESFSVGDIIGIEEKFNIVTPDGVPIIGAMDRVSKIDDETILITDYKTSKYFYTDVELRQDIQLSVYDLVSSIMYPEFKRRLLSLDYLRGDPVYTYRTDYERVEFSKYIASLYKEMLEVEKSFRDGNTVHPSVNDMCVWCDFSDSCDSYQDIINTDHVVSKKLTSMTVEDLLDEYNSIKMKKRIIDEYDKKLKRFVMDKMNREEIDISNDSERLIIKQNKRKYFDPIKLHQFIPTNDFLELISGVDNTKLDKYLTEHPEYVDLARESCSMKYINPFVSKVKNKKK